jgi:diguanylate cyclase (GGDEF)-like protein
MTGAGAGSGRAIGNRKRRRSKGAAACACALALLSLAVPARTIDVQQIVMAAERPADVPSLEAYRAFGSAQGLMQSTVSSLAQDRIGYIWAGSEDGVARYDGYRWQRVPYADPQSAPPIPTALRATDDGAMWAVTDLGTLLRHDGTRMVRIGLEDFGNVRPQTLAIDDASHVWVGSDRGVWRCDVAHCAILPSTRDINVTALYAGTGDDDKTALWLGTVNQGVRRVDDPSGAATLATWRLGAAEGLPSDNIRVITQWGGANGRDLWIGCNFGMARYDGQRLVVWGEALDITASYVSAFATSIDANDEPVLIAGLQRGGLVYVSNDNDWYRYGLHEGLPDNGVSSLLVTDRDRPRPRLWVGSYAGGVLRQEDLYWHVIDTRQGLPSAAVRSVGHTVFPDGVSAFWIGTMEGPVRFHAGRWQPFGPDALAHVIVYDLAGDESGTTWLATDRGLYRWDANGVENYDRNRLGFISNTIITVRPRRGDDGREELWVGTRRGMTRIIDGTPQLPPNPPTVGTTVRKFLDSESRGVRTLWIGGDRGLAAWRGGQWLNDLNACLPFPDVTDLRLAEHGGERALWVATRGGIARIAIDGSGACQKLAPPQLPSAVVYQLQFDRAGRAYLFGYEGVLRLTPDPQAPRDLARMTIERFDADDGLPALEFNRASMRDDDGRIWAGTINGAVVLDPSREPVAQTLRPLLLTRAREIASAAPLTAGTHLPQDRSGVAFDFALLSYEREHLTRYRTELVGLDAAPSPWRAENTVAYERLPAGTYTLKVWARDAFGAISGPREFPFTVDAPWWRGGTALVLAALSLIALGVLAGRFRARAVAARAAILEREVAQRTRDLAEANRRLEVASITDPLTGIANRRSFSQDVAPQLEAFARNPGNAATSARLLALIDLDYFKSINDRYGHAAGDAVLMRIAACLREGAGARGHAFRWGGEEFLVVLDLDGVAQASAAAHALAESVRCCVHSVGGREISVTCSLGWTLWPWHPRSPRLTSLDQALTLADMALYRAKEGGRNRSVGALADDSAAPLPEHPELRVRWQDSSR